MKIAIPYENGQVFQHFGHSVQFKLYTAEEGRITGAEVVSTCLLYTSPSPRDKRQSRMPSSA